MSEGSSKDKADSHISILGGVTSDRVKETVQESSTKNTTKQSGYAEKPDERTLSNLNPLEHAGNVMDDGQDIETADSPSVGNARRPAQLQDLLCCYPVVSEIISALLPEDMLSLSLVSKGINSLLGQSDSSDYWWVLREKCTELECSFKNEPCTGEAVRCIRCRNGFCARYSGAAFILCQSPTKRVRQACRECISTGRNPALTSPTVFGDHTLRQLTAGRNWELAKKNEFACVSIFQERDVTFCASRVDLFDIKRIKLPAIATQPPSARHPVRSWQQVRLPKYYDPAIDRVREHASSRCICIQAGLENPLCWECAGITMCTDYEYEVWSRENMGICECGTLLWDFIGEDGETIAGNGWDPTNHSETLPASEATDGQHGGFQETVVGLCSWCGFRVYRPAGNRGKLPKTEEEYQAWTLFKHAHEQAMMVHWREASGSF